MIFLKFLLATILTAAPFCLSWCLKSYQRKGTDCKCLWPLLWRKLPFLRRANKVIVGRLLRLHEVMKNSVNARRFFTFCIIGTMLVVGLVDVTVTSEAAEAAKAIVENNVELNGGNVAEINVEKVEGLNVYLSAVTYGWASLFCLFFTFLLYWYRFSDWLFTLLHGRKMFCIFGLVVLNILLLSEAQFHSRFSVIGELLYVVMMGAYFYPAERLPMPPKGRKGIFTTISNVFRGRKQTLEAA